jgi:hypothetical protein
MQRYKLYPSSSGGLFSMESENGPWVKHEEVEALEQENIALKAKVEELEQLKQDSQEVFKQLRASAKKAIDERDLLRAKVNT